MWLNVYLFGSLVTIIGASVAAFRSSDRHLSWLSLGLLLALVGMVWPLLALGALQLIAIMLVAKGMRTNGVRRSALVSFPDVTPAVSQWSPGHLAAPLVVGEHTKQRPSTRPPV